MRTVQYITFNLDLHNFNFNSLLKALLYQHSFYEVQIIDDPFLLE